MRHATTCLQTNVGRADRQALALVLDPSTLADGAEPPARVVFVAGRRFDAFHVSMRPVARGGVRLVTPKTPEALAHAARHYDECRDLAQAQQLKNKDIPEGGAKAVVLVDATGHGDDAWAGRGRGAFREYLNRKAVAAFADALLDVSLEGGAPLPYLGPDEQVVPQDITRIVENAARRGHPRPEALMSSKPGAGINHKEFGVTSEGVAVFVERALREVGIDARKDAFRVCFVGGPDGDVAGNLLKIMQRDWPSARVVGVADGSGCAEDPEGLDGNELRRLVEASAPIASFDSKLLGNRGTLRTADDGDGAALRDTMHFRVDADVLVPCGGRPGTIHAGNARDFLKPGDDAAPGAPRAPIVVEGANLFLTPEARQILHGEAGVLVVKDSSANKCGVVCSSYEILAAHLLSRSAFEAQKAVIVAEVLERLRALASLEADLLFKRVLALPGRAARLLAAHLGGDQPRGRRGRRDGERRPGHRVIPRVSPRAPAADARATRYRVAGKAAGRLRARLRRVLRGDAARLRRGHHARRGARQGSRAPRGRRDDIRRGAARRVATPREGARFLPRRGRPRRSVSPPTTSAPPSPDSCCRGSLYDCQ